MQAKHMRMTTLGLKVLTVMLSIGVASPSLALLKSEAAGFYCWSTETTLANSKYVTSNARAVFDGGWIACFALINSSNGATGYEQDLDGYADACISEHGGSGTEWIGEIDYTSYYQDTAANGYAQGIWDSRNYQVVRCDRDGDNAFSTGNNGDLDYKCPTGDAWCMQSAGATDVTNHVVINAVCDHVPPAPNDGLCEDQIDPDCGGTCARRITTHLVTNLDADCDGTKENPAVSQGGLCLYWEWRLPGTSTLAWWTGNLQAMITMSGAQGEKTLNLKPAEGPTPVRTSSFRAYSAGGQTVVTWETASEEQVAGYNLYGVTLGGLEKINEALMPALPPAPGGSTWRVADPGAAPGGTYAWILGEVSLHGEEKLYGPFTSIVAEGTGETVLSPGGGAVRTPRNAGSTHAGRTAPKAGSRAFGLARGEAVRIAVTGDGLHYLDAGMISGIFGFPTAATKNLIGRGQLSLSSRGRPVAYTPASGNAGIYFRGTVPESIFTGENVYWLTKGRGLLMASASGDKPTAADGGTFPATSRAEVDRWPQPALFTDPAADFWVWDYLLAGNQSLANKSFILRTDGAIPGGTVTLTVNLLGGANALGPDADHHVTISLNGTAVGQGIWDGTEQATFSFPVDPALLRDGDNQVTLDAALAPGVPFSFFWLDSLEMAYSRRYRAVDNELVFTGAGNRVVTVNGFTTGNIRVLDISDPYRPIVVQGLNIQADGSGFRVSFRPSSSSATYLATAVSRVPSIAAHNFTGLAGAKNEADYLIIAPDELVDAAASLALHRRSQGLVSKIVRLEDIYDEFNDGIAEPEAIRTFLAHVNRTWGRSPRYVVLAGNGSFDYRDYQKADDYLLPVALVNTPYGLFASDNHFADGDGDGLPELAIGRFPVTSEEEFLRQVDLIKDYEGSWGPWRERVIMTADVPDPHSGDFPADSDLVASEIPVGYTVDSIHLTEGTFDQDRARLLNGLNEGAYLLNYIGHGGLFSLSNLGILSASDVSGLANGERRPLMAAMTCQVGRHEFPGVTTLGEALLLGEDGGAIGVWTASGLSINSDARVLDRIFVRNALDNGTATLGDAVMEALRGFGAEGGLNQYMTEIYTLLGDPALRIR